MKQQSTLATTPWVSGTGTTSNIANHKSDYVNTEQELHMALQPGTQAPDFTLNAHSGAVKLSSLRGKKVVIGFHPASFTGG